MPVYLYIFIFSRNLTPPTTQPRKGREKQKLFKFQRTKVLTESGPGKLCSLHPPFQSMYSKVLKLSFFHCKALDFYLLWKENVLSKQECVYVYFSQRLALWEPIWVLERERAFYGKDPLHTVLVLTVLRLRQESGLTSRLGFYILLC